MKWLEEGGGGMEASKAGFWRAATAAMVRQRPRARERMRAWGGRREAATLLITSSHVNNFGVTSRDNYFGVTGGWRGSFSHWPHFVVPPALA
jgi:hypothetical protein